MVRQGFLETISRCHLLKIGHRLGRSQSVVEMVMDVDLDIVMDPIAPVSRMFGKRQELVVGQVGDFRKMAEVIIEVSHLREVRRGRLVGGHQEEIAIAPGVEELLQRIGGDSLACARIANQDTDLVG